MRKLICHITLLSLALLCSCTKIDSNEVIPSPEKGSITFTVETAPHISASESSRAFTDEEIDTIHDGGGMENLFFILVDPDGIVADVREFSHTSTTYGGEKFSDIKQLSFYITDLDVGDYTVYAYANYALSQYANSEYTLATVKVGEKFTLDDDVYLPLPGIVLPHISNENPLFLTAEQIVPVAVGNSSATIELIRPTALFEMQIYNSTEYNLTVNSLQFRDISPITSNVLPKSAVLAKDAVVEGYGTTITNTYRSMPTYPYRCELGVPDGTTAFVIPPTETLTIYQCCLYESAGSKELYQFDINLSLDAQLVIATTTYSGYEENNYAIVASELNNYMLKNGDYFLYDSGNGILSLIASSSITTDNYQNAEWHFSGSTSGYIQNVATGNRYYRGSINASTSGNNWTFNHRGSGMYRIYRNSSYLYRNGTSVAYGNSSSNRDWQLYTATIKTVNHSEPLEPLDLKDVQINVLQSDASVLPMTQIRRNQDIVLTTNVEYQETSGVFKFYVNPWTERNNSHTFN